MPQYNYEKLVHHTNRSITVVSLRAILGPSGAGLTGVIMEFTVLIQDTVVMVLLKGVPFR